MTKLTYLTPKNAYPCFVAKTYKKVNGKIKLVSDYKLGKLFDFEVDEVRSLKQAFTSLKNHSDNWVRIAGDPKAGLDPIISSVQRNKVNFPEGGSRFILFDIDGWGVPSSAHWDPQHPPSTHRLIKDLLTDKGFPFLVSSDFIFLLTSSQWDNSKLNCHLYFFLDQPIHISRLRLWCKTLADTRGVKIFDPAMERSVQPDYIGRRKCTNFQDPRSESARVSLCINDDRTLSLNTLNAQIDRDLKTSGWKEGGEESGSLLGSNWLSSLEFCGTLDKGINEPAYRAAAQLVRETGRSSILGNVDKYAKLLKTETWKSVELNNPYTNGGRERQKDVETYDTARFKQYITSACDRSFGEEADSLRDMVVAAIEQASDGDVSLVFDRPVMQAYSKLKSSHVGVYAQVKNKFKETLRGKVTVSDFEKACSGSSDTKGEEGLGFLGDREQENKYIEKVLSRFDWLVDHHGASWCGWALGESGGSYRITPVDANLRNVLYKIGIDVSKGTVSDRFGEKALRLLYGQEEYYKNTDKSRFQLANVGLRVAPEGGSYSNKLDTWIDLGLQTDGKSLCVKVNDKEVSYSSAEDCPVRWRSSEISAPISIATEEQIEDRFGSIDVLKSWTVNRLFDFFNLKEKDKPVLLGIILAILSGRGTSPLIEFTGPPSAGKSVAADLMIDLLDPVKGGIESGIGKSDLGSVNHKDFINVIQSRYLSVFDNVSKLDVKWQDRLCQAATGVSKDHRIMYVGAYVKIFAKRPIILTALDSLVTRPDLESRKETLSFDGKKFAIKPRHMLDEWAKDRSFLFVGLLHLLKEALSVFDRDSANTGLDARRMWYGVADKLYFKNPEEIKSARDERKSVSALHMLVNSDFCLAILSWLQHKEEQGETEFEDLVIHHLNDFTSYIRENQGTTIKLKTSIDDLNWRISAMDVNLPETSRGFTWELNKNYHIIKTLSGWEVNAGGKRTSAGWRRTFKKDLVLDTKENLV